MEGVGFVGSFRAGGRLMEGRSSHGAVSGRSGHGVRSARMTAANAKVVDSERRPGSNKGFVEEMRFVAMKLHTKDQSKEGQQEESVLPINEWRPTKADYLQFLVDSRAIYEYMEGVVAAAKSDNMLSKFQNSGLERVAALNKDIAWFAEQGIPTPEPTKKATAYVDYLKKLVAERPSAFLCHWYNYYFAHTAGGRMIGRMMANLLFDGRELEFYKWDRDVKEILGEVREKIDEVAADWPRAEKDDCLNETNLAFSYSGTVLGNLAKAGQKI